MNSQENRDWERKLQELESQLDSKPLQSSVNPTQPQPLVVEHETDDENQMGEIWLQVRNWFDRLPSAGKIAVVAIAAIIGLSLLRTVFQLVASLITLAVLAVVLYFIYKFFIASQSSQ